MPGPYRRSTAWCGSSATFSGGWVSATVKVTGPVADLTHCVMVRPRAT